MNEVDQYIAKQKSPQKEILIKLRKIILKAVPKINEEMKMGVPWYEGKFYLVGLKDHVNLGFAVKGMPEKYRSQLEGKGEYMRHLKFYKPADIDKKKITSLIKATKKHYKPAH